MTLGSTKPPKPFSLACTALGTTGWGGLKYSSCSRYLILHQILDHSYMCFPLFLLTFELGELNVQARVGT